MRRPFDIISDSLDYFIVGLSAFATEVFYASYIHRYEERKLDRRFALVTLGLGVLSILLGEAFYVAIGFRSYAQAIYVGVSIRVAIIGAPEFVYFTFSGKRKLRETKREYVDRVRQRLKFNEENLQEMEDRLNSGEAEDVDMVARAIAETRIRIRELQKVLNDMGESEGLENQTE